MIDLPHSSSRLAHGADHVKIKVLGLGGAGSNALDRAQLDGLEFAEAIAINTDVQALTSSIVAAKLQIGRMTTRGLGAGGDPEIGLAAAEEAVEELQRVVAGAELIFICAGLGGGTGSGAAAAIAGQAREQGALVVAFATMPFAFEGRRRRAQAEEALHALREAADVVICFENDRMGETVAPQAGIHQAFAAADTMLSQSLRAVCELFKRSGLMSIGFGDLLRVLGGQHACCLFGHGESETDNRAHEALARALKSPLMDRGRLLHEASAVLVNIAGGPSTTLNEVQILMEEFQKSIGRDTQVFFGTAIDPKLGHKLCVTIISALGGPVGERSAVIPTRELAQALVPEPALGELAPARLLDEEPVILPELPQGEPAEVFAEAAEEPAWAGEEPAAQEESPFFAEPEAEPAPEPVPEPAPRPAAVETPVARPSRPAPRVPRPFAPEPMLPMEMPASREAVAPKAPQQESLPFEPVSRGRFEKSEPTIVDGQDLDVPTFMRRNLRVK